VRKVYAFPGKVPTQFLGMQVLGGLFYRGGMRRSRFQGQIIAVTLQSERAIIEIMVVKDCKI
jgi:hypothetical protein